MTSQCTIATSVTQDVRIRAREVGTPERCTFTLRVRLTNFKQAETLRVRLQLAQFKIRTNQIDVPFARLQMTTEGRIDSAACSRPGSSRSQSGVCPPKLLPLPEPKFGSSSTFNDGSTGGSLGRENGGGLREEGEEVFRTPALPRRRQRTVEEGASPTEGCKPGRGEEERLTSSAIKGDAAMSLLGLRGRQ